VSLVLDKCQDWVYTYNRYFSIEWVARKVPKRGLDKKDRLCYTK